MSSESDANSQIIIWLSLFKRYACIDLRRECHVAFYGICLEIYVSRINIFLDDTNRYIVTVKYLIFCKIEVFELQNNNYSNVTLKLL